MQDVLSAALGSLGVIIVALIGLFGARKLGIGESQEKLVATLRDLLEAQDTKIKLLEESVKDGDARVAALELKVEELTNLTVSQAVEIQTLRLQTQSAR